MLKLLGTITEFISKNEQNYLQMLAMLTSAQFGRHFGRQFGQEKTFRHSVLGIRIPKSLAFWASAFPNP